jgi:hypothetical protein
MTDERVARTRLNSLPPIRRSRLWRLYAEDGRRFLDLWMEGGASILGAKGTRLGTAAKAAIDTGQTRPFPSVRQARLEKALLVAYPGHAAVRLYRDEGRARAAAALATGGEPPAEIRPFAEFLDPRGSGPAGPAKARIALPILPCPSALAPAVLLFADAQSAEASDGDLLPPLLLECAHRSLLEMERFRLTYNESLWKRVDRRLKAYFERRGPYLYPRCAEGAYEALFAAALSAGILLSPRYEGPSIIPGDFDDGELAALAAALAGSIHSNLTEPSAPC